MVLHNLNYPLDLKFVLTTLSSDFNVTDSQGRPVAYARQKLFKLKEDVTIYTDSTRTTEAYRIRADRWLDFNVTFDITDAQGQRLGSLGRKGMKSILKRTYEVFGAGQESLFHIKERNAWTKFIDNMVGEIPIIGMFSGYFLNPTYDVTGQNGELLFELKKMPSLVGRRFQLNKLIDIDDEKESLVVLSLMMVVLMERATG